MQSLHKEYCCLSLLPRFAGGIFGVSFRNTVLLDKPLLNFSLPPLPPPLPPPFLPPLSTYSYKALSRNRWWIFFQKKGKRKNYLLSSCSNGLFELPIPFFRRHLRPGQHLRHRRRSNDHQILQTKKSGYCWPPSIVLPLPTDRYILYYNNYLQFLRYLVPHLDGPHPIVRRHLPHQGQRLRHLGGKGSERKNIRNIKQGCPQTEKQVRRQQQRRQRQ